MKIFQKNYSKVLFILAIFSGENAATLEPYPKVELLTFPVLDDLDNKVKNLYKVESTPAYFFIDSAGKVASIETGLLSYTELGKQLETILP